MSAKPKTCQRCQGEAGLFTSLDGCVICGRWICRDCGAGGDWRNPRTNIEGSACKACAPEAVKKGGIGSEAGSEVVQYAQKVVIPDLKKWVGDLIAELRQILNDDVNAVVDDAAGRIGGRLDTLIKAASINLEDVVEASVRRALALVQEAAPAVIESAGGAIDNIVQRNTEVVIAKADTALREMVRFTGETVVKDALASIDALTGATRDLVIADARKIVEQVGESLSERADGLLAQLQGSIGNLVAATTKTLRDELRGIARDVVASAGVEVDELVQRNVDYAINRTTSGLRDALSFKDSALLGGVQKTVGEIGAAAEKINRALDAAKDLSESLQPVFVRVKEGDSEKTIESVLETARSAKDVVDSIERFLPTAQQIVTAYLKDKEAERAYGWRHIMGYAAVGLLVTSFAYALYFKFGQTMNPGVAVKLVWIAISFPMAATIVTSGYFVWRKARATGAAGAVGHHAKSELLLPHILLPKIIWLLLLVGCNVFLNLYL